MRIRRKRTLTLHQRREDDDLALIALSRAAVTRTSDHARVVKKRDATLGASLSRGDSRCTYFIVVNRSLRLSIVRAAIDARVDGSHGNPP